MVRWRLLVVSAISVATFYGQVAKAEIRIATAGPMTGLYAWSGEQYQRAAELAIEDLNGRGGILGQRVELIVGDDACDPDQAVALARKLASEAFKPGEADYFPLVSRMQAAGVDVVFVGGYLDTEGFRSNIRFWDEREVTSGTNCGCF